MTHNRLSNRWQQLARNEVRALQAAQLSHYLSNVVLPFSAHYRDLFQKHGIKREFIRSLEDLQEIPFTSKEDLVATPENPAKSRDFILIPDPEVLRRRPGTILKALFQGRKKVQKGFEKEFRPIFMTSTTGRSADPVPFLFSQYDLDNLAMAGERLFGVCGGKSDYKAFNMFPYAPHLAFWQTHYGSSSFGSFCLSTGGGKVMGTEATLRLIKKVKPDILIGMPTFLYHLMHQAAEEGARFESLKGVVLGGEKCPDGMRRKLKNLALELGAKEIDVVSTYGFTEAKMAWGECPVAREEQTSGYHLYPDLGLFEVINPKTGELVPEGNPGELVFTPLDSRGSVVLRYRTGDYLEGGLVYDPCPHCGRTLPRLVGKISRSSEVRKMQLDKIKGTLVDFNQLEHVLDDAPHVGAWQLEMRKINDDPLELDELILHVQKNDGVDDEHLVKEIKERFFAQTEIHPNKILFHDAEEIRRLQGVGVQLKEQKIVDHRPPTGKPVPA